MVIFFKELVKTTLYLIIIVFYPLTGFVVAYFSGFSRKKTDFSLVWGSTPILNNSYWSRAMQATGYDSQTFTHDFYSAINRREDWDRVLTEEYRFLPDFVKPFLAFLDALLRYDVFFISFDGFFIGNTPLWWMQAPFLKLAGKKIVVIPYGSDAYVYQRIKSTGLLHGLLMSYPLPARDQERIAKRVDYWCKHADAVITGLMGPDGFGRWDVLLPSNLYIDLDLWQASDRVNDADGKMGWVTIVHAPNHRGFKGTEFIIDAVNRLKQEGLLVKLILLEKVQNSKIREQLRHHTDILVDQVIATGHALNALEGLASGIPVISNLEDEAYILPFRRWTYFGECPIASATPENLTDVLRKLITRPKLRAQLGRAGREYVEKYHGLDSAQYLFNNVIDYVYGRKESLMNLYHPLLGEYPKRKPPIQHPLVNNRIVD
ncbi:aminotransferase [Phormidium tenue NIES-30]|uniref:Aminotransferase n=1 Tax=Phormidium tenue NIES-30 TaxID=549789 RepID=A0A1U7J8K0_9CYAN|nr:aminotransferase [Phormidium tenue NIES-30]